MKRYLLLFIVFIYGTLLLAQDSGNYWNPNTGAYPTNMSVIAVVQLSGEEQSTVNIELGAFYVSTDELNGELRGSKRLAHIQTVDGSIDRYIAHITVYGNHGDSITFRLYDHELEQVLDYVTENNISYIGDGTLGDVVEPHVINFAKSITDNKMMNEVTSDDDVIINGDITISENSNITAQSMKISDGKSLTIQNGGSLTVLENVTNTNVDALIIEEGGQIIQYNDNVAATFKNEIEGEWGGEDNTGWQFISSPVKDVNISDFDPTTFDYDLYMYDGTQELQWVNFKKLSPTMYDFSSNPFNNGWTRIPDPPFGWTYSDDEQNVYSYSNIPPFVTSADNYLITPQLSIISGTKLNFKAKGVEKNDNVEEKFKVLLSTSTNTNTNDFDVILRECSITNTDYEEFSIDLSNYAGQYIYIAFYHYGQGTGQLIIDDVEIGIEASFEKGIGYLASYQNEGNMALFKGNLNYLANGGSYVIEDLNYSTDDVLANFHLLGNPFPFDINWSTDVATSDVYNGFARIKSSDGAYEYFNSSGTIKSGEGFMVKTTGDNAFITFSKGSSKAYRKEAKSVNIIASNSKGSDNLIVSLDDNEKAGFPKLDNFNENIANVYVRESEVNYGIFNYGNDINEIPFYFNAKEIGNYTLTFDIEGEFDNLYLLDKMTGEKVNILMENEYSFMANSNDNPERFVLLTKTKNEDESHGIENFVYINNDDLYINAEGTIQIIDMMGRIIMTEENHNGVLSISNLNSAAYIVRCVNENEVKTQKIVVL